MIKPPTLRAIACCLLLGISSFGYGQKDLSSLSSALLQKALQTSSNAAQKSTSNPDINVPTVPGPSVPSIKKSSPSHSPSKNTTLPSTPGTIISNPQMKFNGALYFAPFSLEIHQNYQGKDFLQQLSSSQIRNLTCVEWTAFPYKQQSSAFQFVCTLYNIQDLEGHNYVYKKVLPSLSQILFKNEKGASLFYFYFIDYVKNKRWENLNLPANQKVVSEPLSGVIRTVILGANSPTPTTSPTLVEVTEIEKKSYPSTAAIPSLKKEKKPPITVRRKIRKTIAHPKKKNKKIIPKVSPLKKKEEDLEKKHEKIPIKSRR